MGDPRSAFGGRWLVKGRIDEIDIFRVHFFLTQAQTFAKSLEVYNFSLAEEANHVVDVRVVR